MVPFDGEASDSRLLGKHVAADLLDDGLGRRVGVELIGIVLVIHVVANADEFAAIVRAGQQDDSNTEDVCVGDATRLGGVGLENKLVNTHRNRSDKERVELLVVLIPGLGWVRVRWRRHAYQSCFRGNVTYEVAEPT